MKYENMSPIANKLLNKDGSITTFEGENVISSTNRYDNMSPIANKILNPDGSISLLSEVLGGGGGGTGTSNYNLLSNLPKINNVELKGNLTTEDLDINIEETDPIYLADKPNLATKAELLQLTTDLDNVLGEHKIDEDAHSAKFDSIRQYIDENFLNDESLINHNADNNAHNAKFDGLKTYVDDTKLSKIQSIINANKYFKIDNDGNTVFEDINVVITTPTQIYVDINSDDEIENGTINYPFKSIQSAVDSAISGTTIFIASGEYNENVTISGKENVTLAGDSAIEQYRVIVNGGLIINTYSSRIGVLNIEFMGNYSYSSSGTNICLDNVSINGATDITGNGTHTYDFCRFRNLQVKNSSFVNIRYSKGLNSSIWEVMNTATLSLVNVENIKCIHRDSSNLIANNVSFINTTADLIALISTADAGNLILHSASFLLKNNTYCKLEKTGNCDYSLGQSDYDLLNVTVSGNRILSGINSEQVYFYRNSVKENINKHFNDVTLHFDAEKTTKLELLNNATSNIQAQLNKITTDINNLETVFNETFVVDSYADMLLIDTQFESDLCIVRIDETKENLTTMYLNKESTWIFVTSLSVKVRDFTFEKIDIDTETTGIFEESRIDVLIARKEDIKIDDITIKRNVNNELYAISEQSSSSSISYSPFEVAINLWVSSSTYANYLWEADVVVGGITDKDFARIELDVQSTITANNAMLLSSAITLENKIRLFSKAKPLTKLTGLYSISKEAGL